MAAWARSVLVVAGTVALSVGNSAVFADEPDAATKAYAQRVAITVCGTCHGSRGNSTHPKFPRLAGQNVHYLAAQLKAFRSQTRGDPDAVGYMWGMAGELDDTTVGALAGYYAEQKTEPSSAGRDSALVARGRESTSTASSRKACPLAVPVTGPTRTACRTSRDSQVSTRNIS